MGKVLKIPNADFSRVTISGAEITQEFGNSPRLVISQKTVTEKFAETDTSIGNIKKNMPSESISDGEIYGIISSNEKLDTVF